jgi:large subunit ribosomal protein L24
MSNKIARNDLVEVISGDHKGVRGRVLAVLRDSNRVVVEKVRLVKRHRRQVQGQATGGIVEMEAPIHLSNVKLVEKSNSRGGGNG